MSADGATRINSYIAPLEQGCTGAVLIFLEDAGLLAEKVQQSNLAALGRLSASIAHEIRNPLGAISHASQLLGESPALDPADKRLTQIISEHTQRVNQIIENVMSLSKRDRAALQLVSCTPDRVRFPNSRGGGVALTLATAMQDVVRSGARVFVPFLVCGYPDPTTFAALLQASRPRSGPQSRTWET